MTNGAKVKFIPVAISILKCVLAKTQTVFALEFNFLMSGLFAYDNFLVFNTDTHRHTHTTPSPTSQKEAKGLLIPSSVKRMGPEQK